MVAITQNNSLLVSQNFGANLLNDFFAFLDVSQKSLMTYKGALKQLFAFFTDNAISTPGHDDIIAFKKSLEAQGRKPSTIALYLSAARRFFDWCEQRGIYQNITTGIKSPKQDTGHKRDFFGSEQIQAILAKMDRSTLAGKRDYTIFTLIATCGLRTIEVSRANIKDLTVLGGSDVLFIQGKGKTSKTDYVKIIPEVMAIIRDYLNARGKVSPDAPLFAGIGNRNHEGRLTTRTIRAICKAAMRQAGFDSSRLSTHSLRHSAITLALMGGMTLAEVQAFARHSSINTTMIYAHTVNRLQSQCERTIGNFIFGQSAWVRI